MSLDAGLIAASRQFTSALLASDDRDVVRIAMGLLAVVSMLVRDDPASRALIAQSLRQMAAEMENALPPAIN